MKKKSKLEKFTPFLIGTCMLTLVAACGSDDDDSGSGSGDTGQQEERPQEGQYRVVFSPVNPNVAGEATGTGTFRHEGDEFEATINVDGAPTAIHMQHVHVGSRCATAADDENGDGYIDAVEAGSISGGALVPLDSDLRAQEAGGTYPSGAGYEYNESTSFQAMLADLRLPDEDTTDTLVKLDADENLNLEGKVVEIHGIPTSTTLPATVRGIDGLSPQQTLPILCGVITREDTGTTTGGTGTTTGGTGTTTGDEGSTGGTGTTTGDDGSTGGTGTTTGGTGTTTGTTTGTSGADTTTGFTGI